MTKWTLALAIASALVYGCGGDGPEIKPESASATSSSARQVSTRTTQPRGKQDWTTCDLIVPEDAGDALGAKVKPTARGSTCDFNGPRGAASIESRTYTDTSASAAEFADMTSKDAQDATYSLIQGLGESAYSVRNRVAVQYRDVHLIVTFDPTGDHADESERILRALAGSSLGQLAQIHRPAGRPISEDEIASFFER